MTRKVDKIFTHSFQKRVVNEYIERLPDQKSRKQFEGKAFSEARKIIGKGRLMDLCKNKIYDGEYVKYCIEAQLSHTDETGNKSISISSDDWRKIENKAFLLFFLEMVSKLALFLLLSSYIFVREGTTIYWDLFFVGVVPILVLPIFEHEKFMIPYILLFAKEYVKRVKDETKV